MDDSNEEERFEDEYRGGLDGVQGLRLPYIDYSTNRLVTTDSASGYYAFANNPLLIPTSQAALDFLPNQNYATDRYNNAAFHGQTTTSAPLPHLMQSSTGLVGPAYGTLGMDADWPYVPTLPSQYAHQAYAHADPWPASTNVDHTNISPAPLLWATYHEQQFFAQAQSHVSEEASPTIADSMSHTLTQPMNTPPHQASNSFPATPPQATSYPQQTDPSSRFRPLAPAAAISSSPEVSSSQQQNLPVMTFSPPSDAQTPTSSRNVRKRKHDDQSEEKRKKIREMRACLRCRMYHLDCSDGEPCDRCQHATETATFFQPCRRPDLDDIVVFRTGNSRAGQESSKFPKLTWTSEDPAPRILNLLFPFKKRLPVEQLPKLEISVRKFIPGELDTLDDSYSDVDGNVYSIRHSAFATSNHQQTTSRFKKFLEACQPHLQDEMIETLSKHNPIMSCTLEEVRRVAAAEARSHNPNSTRPSGLVSIALRLLSIVYFAGPALVMADNTVIPWPEVDGGTGDASVFGGDVPTPAVLDFQLDTMSIHHMTEVLALLQKEMKKKYFIKNNKKYWYEVYLATFLLLASLEHVHQHQLGIIHESKSMNDDFTVRVGYICRSMIAKWENSAQNLLYHFRYLLRGNLPFGDLPAKELKGVDAFGKVYLTRIKGLVEEQKDTLESARESAKNGKYDRRMYWLSQLFVQEKKRAVRRSAAVAQTGLRSAV